MRKFNRNQNVLYRQGSAFYDAKIVHYDPVSDSYVIKIDGKDGERETVAERLYHKDDLQVRLSRAVSALESRVAALEKTVRRL